MILIQEITDCKPVKDHLLIDQEKQKDDRLTVLEKKLEQMGRDLKAIKEGQEVLNKSLENKVGTVMETLQEQVYDLTTLVKSLKYDDGAYEVTGKNISAMWIYSIPLDREKFPLTHQKGNTTTL